MFPLILQSCTYPRNIHTLIKLSTRASFSVGISTTSLFPQGLRTLPSELSPQPYRLAPFCFTFVTPPLSTSPTRTNSLATLVGSSYDSKLSLFGIHLGSSGSLSSTPCGLFPLPSFIFPGLVTRGSFMCWYHQKCSLLHRGSVWTLCLTCSATS